VFCEGKTTEDVLRIARAMGEAGQTCILTRTTQEMRDRVHDELGHLIPLRRSDEARWMALVPADPVMKLGRVGVVAAGTTDRGVAEEAAHTAEVLGSPVDRLYDVGVAGLHRLLRHVETIRSFRVLVVVAGMEGALPSVVSGLVSAPVIAVPTSVGYGAAFNGVAALLGMLNSCSPGISVVNIDNGYGAGYLADVINGLGERNPSADGKPRKPRPEAL